MHDCYAYVLSIVRPDRRNEHFINSIKPLHPTCRSYTHQQFRQSYHTPTIVLPGEIVWYMQGLARDYDAFIRISMNFNNRDAYQAMLLHPLTVTYAVMSDMRPHFQMPAEINHVTMLCSRCRGCGVRQSWCMQFIKCALKIAILSASILHHYNYAARRSYLICARAATTLWCIYYDFDELQGSRCLSSDAVASGNSDLSPHVRYASIFPNGSLNCVTMLTSHCGGCGVPQSWFMSCINCVLKIAILSASNFDIFPAMVTHAEKSSIQYDDDALSNMWSHETRNTWNMRHHLFYV